jgi:hypothetical protein
MNNDDEKPRYKQLSELPVGKHQHDFLIATGPITLRYCGSSILLVEGVTIMAENEAVHVTIIASFNQLPRRTDIATSVGYPGYLTVPMAGTGIWSRSLLKLLRA